MKRKVFKSGSLKSKGLVAIIISLLFALVLSACSVVAVDSNKPIEGNVDVTSETRNGGQTLPFTLAQLGTATNTYNYAYTGGVQTLTLKVGYVYKFEVWGGKGSQGADGTLGGAGGYAMGYFSLASASAGQTVYIFVGGAAANNGNGIAGGYNGGGSSIGTYKSGGGGGGTDIRTTNTIYTQAQWNAFTNATDPRLIVAGGGGGGSNSGSEVGGTGGGLEGGEGGGSTGGKATQTSWGYDGAYGGTSTKNGTYGTPGARFSGGNGINVDGSGGGGGLFGGGGSGNGAGGGSGYLGGVDSLSNSSATTTNGANNGNGKATITEYAVWTAKSPSYLNKARLTSFTIPKLDVANESTSTTTALTFNNTSNLYLDNAGTQAATDYFTVTGTADNLTVTPKVSIENRTFYAYMKSASGALVYAPISVSTANDPVIMKS